MEFLYLIKFLILKNDLIKDNFHLLKQDFILKNIYIDIEYHYLLP